MNIVKWEGEYVLLFPISTPILSINKFFDFHNLWIISFGHLWYTVAFQFPPLAVQLQNLGGLFRLVQSI